MESTEPVDILHYIQGRIDHDKIWLSVALSCFVIGILLFSLSTLFEGFMVRIFLLLGVFLAVFGLVMGLLIVEQVLYHIDHYKSWGNTILEAFRKERGLEEVVVQSTGSPEPQEALQPFTIFTETKRNSTSVTWEIQDHPDRPSKDFLRYIFSNKEESGLISTERDLQDAGELNGLWNTAQVKRWLKVLDQTGVTNKIYEMERGNSRRCLTRGLTLQQVYTKFKYSEESPVSPPDSP